MNTPSTSPSLPPSTRIGPVHLAVSNLSRSLAFYSQALGFGAEERRDGAVWLSPASGSEPLLVLTETPHGRAPRHATGLYHFAILVPSRKDLACALRRLIEQSAPPPGASDHGVSEALYLADPDGNGIEIYRDRPKDLWPLQNGGVRMTIDPLDLEGLLGELGGENGREDTLASGTTMGHIHLKVASISEAERFYCDLVGFERIQRFGSSASFVSAGGYHHHIGMNTWESAGASPPPPGAPGLRAFTILLPGQAELEQAAVRLRQAGISLDETPQGILGRDPAGNGLLLATPGMI